MSRKLTLPKIVDRDFVQPVTKGGTGSMQLSKAPKNISLATIVDKDQVGGPVSLDANGRIPGGKIVSSNGTNKVNVLGPIDVIVGENATFLLTDFDTFRNYVISVSSGSYSRLGNDTIVYTAPLAAGSSSMTINGRVIPINIVTPRPATPNIVTPVEGASNIQPNNANFTSSTFLAVGASFTHASSDWQLSTDINFASIFRSVVGDTVNKTSWAENGFSISSTYYVRVRYKGSNGVYSDWSNPSRFSTSSSGVISIEEAIFAPNDRAANDQFGYAICTDVGGTRVAISSPGKNNGTVNCGAVYIFLRSGASWVLEQKLPALDPIEGQRFGESLTMTRDGTRLIVGAIGSSSTVATGSVSKVGAVYSYTRFQGTWTFEQRLQSPDLVANCGYGAQPGISDDGLVLVVGSPVAPASTQATGGAAYVYRRVGSVWSQEAKLQANSPANGGKFGNATAISANGNLITVGFVGYGVLYAFVYQPGQTPNWLFEARIFPPDIDAIPAMFGASFSMSADGSRVVVSAPNATNGGVAGAGAAYVYTRTNGNWAQETRLINPGADATNNNFGFSVSISDSGLRATVGSVLQTFGTPASSGAGINYIRQGTSWTMENYGTASVKQSQSLFGSAVVMSGNGLRVFVGARNFNPTGQAAAGQAYAFR